jgi:serine/threonine-protein kinase
VAEPASTIGRFKILREIGRGAMGVVYEAHDPVLDRTVALKVVRSSAVGEEARLFEKRFMADARIAAKLHHPGIVVVHDVGSDPATGAPFIALELLPGRTLADLAAEGPLDWRAVLHVVAQVARALDHAHRHGVVHRDIKPANVVVLPSGEAKVMDFGIARLETARQRLTTTGEFVGTPLYTAPEQAKTEEIDGRADVFSLASVAYTLLTGRAAFDAPTIPAILHRVVYEEPEPPSRIVPDLPPAVERVLARALAKDPEHRYPTAEALAEDAEDVLAGRPPRHAAADDLVVVDEADSPLAALVDSSTRPAAPLPPLPPTGGATRSLPSVPRRRRWPRRTLVLAGVAAALGLVAFLWAPWRPEAPSPAPPRPRRAAAPRPTPAPSDPGRLRIDFDHPLRSGTLRVFVDDQLALEERLSGQQKKKALVFRLHEGTFRDELEVPAGLHEVRMEVRWEDNVRTERIVGNFPPGATRRLEADLGRIRRDLKLEWK